MAAADRHRRRNRLVDRGTHRGRDRLAQGGRQERRAGQQINRFGEYIGNFALYAGGLSALGLALAEAEHFWIANSIFAALILAALISSAVKIVAYRRGFQPW